MVIPVKEILKRSPAIWDGHFRLRVGDFRVIFVIAWEGIVMFGCAHINEMRVLQTCDGAALRSRLAVPDPGNGQPSPSAGPSTRSWNRSPLI
jgi:hypothetical protein